ncbi:hypothetical protein TNCV_1271181 [Trichonephila clavipes]|nr:hypothetical protein TNCV_1271181 [Trichonephila clavipes]
MKTSSVEFISLTSPSPMERKCRRFVLLRRIFQPWQWKRKREIVLNRRQNSTEENIDAFNQKIQLVEKMFLCR